MNTTGVIITFQGADGSRGHPQPDRDQQLDRRYNPGIVVQTTTVGGVDRQPRP